MPATKPPAELTQLLCLLDEAYYRKSWHGTNLRGSLRGLTAAQAAWRPPRALHSIADNVMHCAYWKYAVRRRLRNEKRGSFALKGSNWFPLPDPLSETAWHEYVALLDAEHRALRAAVAALSPAQLAQPSGRTLAPAPGRTVPRSPSGMTPTLALIRGVVLHDIYHAGQIQLLKGLHKRAMNIE